MRGSLMIGLIGVLALSVSLSGGVGGEGDVRFTAGSPTTEDISPAGSAERAIENRLTETASRSRDDASVAATPAPTATATDTPAPQPPCHITYSVVPERANRFTVVIVIANTSAQAIDGWTLRWDFPPTQKIIYGWNALVTNGPDGGAATDIAIDQVIPVGGNVTIGFVGKSGAWIPTPTGFTLNGALCQWQPAITVISPPSVVTVTPTASTSAPASSAATTSSAPAAASTSAPALPSSAATNASVAVSAAATSS